MMNYTTMSINILIVVAAVFMQAGPASAAGEQRLSGKELTLMHSRNCAELTTTLKAKIEKLQEEISKGKRIYTPQEIRKLESKLKEMDEMMDYMMYIPSN